MASKCSHCSSVDVSSVTDHYSCQRCGGTTWATGGKRTASTTEFVVNEQPDGREPITKCPWCKRGRHGDFSHSANVTTCMLCGGIFASDGTKLARPTVS